MSTKHSPIRSLIKFLFEKKSKTENTINLSKQSGENIQKKMSFRNAFSILSENKSGKRIKESIEELHRTNQINNITKNKLIEHFNFLIKEKNKPKISFEKAIKIIKENKSGRKSEDLIEELYRTKQINNVTKNKLIKEKQIMNLLNITPKISFKFFFFNNVKSITYNNKEAINTIIDNYDIILFSEKYDELYKRWFYMNQLSKHYENIFEERFISTVNLSKKNEDKEYLFLLTTNNKLLISGKFYTIDCFIKMNGEEEFKPSKIRIYLTLYDLASLGIFKKYLPNIKPMLNIDYSTLTFKENLNIINYEEKLIKHIDRLKMIGFENAYKKYSDN
jgi:hypothetical protein